MESVKFFESTVLDAFGFLVDDLGFRHVETFDFSRERGVNFRNDTTDVSVHDEAGCRPWVVLGRLDNGLVAESHGLFMLLRLRCPEHEADLECKSTFFGPSGYEELSRAILVRADLVQKWAADILSGDFSVFPILRVLGAVHTREENIKDFGTSTGETPRFTHRPTFEELFADAKNDGMVQARVYQAYWDYDYNIITIATYLAISEDDVKGMLAGWDRLEEPLLKESQDDLV
jgi:hypothetical protein